MPEASDEVKRKAAKIVLDRLGGEAFDILKIHLHRTYAMSFDPKSSTRFSLDQLYFGLSVLIGEDLAKELMQQIADEIAKILQSRAH